MAAAGGTSKLKKPRLASVNSDGAGAVAFFESVGVRLGAGGAAFVCDSPEAVAAALTERAGDGAEAVSEIIRFVRGVMAASSRAACAPLRRPAGTLAPHPPPPHRAHAADEAQGPSKTLLRTVLGVGALAGAACEAIVEKVRWRVPPAALAASVARCALRFTSAVQLCGLPEDADAAWLAASLLAQVRTYACACVRAVLVAEELLNAR